MVSVDMSARSEGVRFDNRIDESLQAPIGREGTRVGCFRASFGKELDCAEPVTTSMPPAP